MNGIIVNFRGTRRRKEENQLIVQPAGVESKEQAEKLVGKKAVWKSPGKEPAAIAGRVSAAHGANGCVRVIFERGLPGQALGTQVSIEA
jgi:large subunit ribosomal protein L35Ae